MNKGESTRGREKKKHLRISVVDNTDARLHIQLCSTHIFSTYCLPDAEDTIASKSIGLNF